jgi:Sulfotransferase family
MPNNPFFEIGVARSGTTLLSLMLDAHPDLAIPYESHFIADLYKEKDIISGRLINIQDRKNFLEETLRRPYVQRWDYTPTIDDIDLDNCCTLSSSINQVFAAYARHHKKGIWGDKTPSYITNIDALHHFFPDAKYIHLIRDGRDVALSLMEQWFGPNDFISALQFWKEHIVIGRKMLAMLPSHQVYELRLEDLVEQPETKLTEICDFLNLPYEIKMLESYQANAAKKVGASRASGIHQNLSSNLSINNVTKWQNKLNPAKQALAWEIAGELLVELGYPSGIKHSNFKLPQKAACRLQESWHYRFGERLPRIMKKPR